MTRKRDIGWELWRSFLAALDTGSLSAAARRLGLTQPTLGRHVAELEAAIGTALFTRAPTGLTPTAAALALLPHAEAMAAAAEALRRAASGEAEGETGTVRLAASEIVAIEVLPPLLAAFRDAHPGIAIELSVSNRQEDLLRRDADIAVRMTRPLQEALIARRIGEVRIGLYAHRSYAASHPLPRDQAELFGHALIGVDRDIDRLKGIVIAGRQVEAGDFSWRSDSDIAQLAALRAGFGIGPCQQPIARRCPDLLPVLPEEIAFALEIWLVMHEDQRASRRIRLLFDHLATGLADYLRPPRSASAEGLTENI